MYRVIPLLKYIVADLGVHLEEGDGV
jgi:hypothetical protein